MPKLDLGSGAAGATSGALTGATLGSAVPGLGTAIGAGLGGVAGGLLGLFGNRRKKPKKVSTFDRSQQDLFKQYIQSLQGQGGQFSDSLNFNPEQTQDFFQKNVAQPSYQNFQENVIPGITGQFRGANLQNSSYLGGALAKAGTDVQRNLDAQLSRMLFEGQNNSLDRRLSALNNILGTQTFAYQKPQQSAIDSMLSGFSGAAGKYAGNNIMDLFRQQTPTTAATS